MFFDLLSLPASAVSSLVMTLVHDLTVSFYFFDIKFKISISNLFIIPVTSSSILGDQGSFYCLSFSVLYH